jgi:hypothetical protein
VEIPDPTREKVQLPQFVLAADVSAERFQQRRALLPTPGLNSKDDDFDPCVIVLPTRE